MNDKGLVNFRDIGGIRVPSGKLQSGYFFRSGQIAGISQEQTAFLQDQCRIRDVYDFRSTDEVKQAPDSAISGAKYYHIDILSDKTSNGASLGAMITDGNKVHENMLKTYESIVLSQSAQQGYHDFMTDLLVDADYLRHANDVLLEHFGSFDGYLKNGLDLPSDYVARFREKFVTD